MELQCKSSAGSKTVGVVRREDLDLGRPVSTSTIFGLRSKLFETLSRHAESLLLWNDDVFSLRVSSNLSCDQSKQIANRATQHYMAQQPVLEAYQRSPMAEF